MVPMQDSYSSSASFELLLISFLTVHSSHLHFRRAVRPHAPALLVEQVPLRLPAALLRGGRRSEGLRGSHPRPPVPTHEVLVIDATVHVPERVVVYLGRILGGVYRVCLEVFRGVLGV